MELTELAAASLIPFGMKGGKLTFLRHNENAVYRLQSPDGVDYVLRLHLPRPGLDDTMLMHRREWLESELLWLEALDRKSDITVQRPVRMGEGGLLAELPEGCGAASLLHWLPGVPFDQKAENAGKLAEAVGELAAKLHDFVLRWPQSIELARPRYDSARVAKAMGQLWQGVALGLFSPEGCRALAEGAEQICTVTDRENATDGAQGLIHSDLGLGNLIVCGQTVSPIDFGLCGHGPLLMDVGGLMGTFDHPALRRAVLAGYRKRRPIPPAQHRVIEAFFLSGIYFFMAMHLRNPDVQEWFGRRLPIILREYVAPFCRGEDFLHTLLGP